MSNPNRDPFTSRGWLNLRSGTAWFPLDPDPAAIKFSDIAFALSNLCRFGGHVLFYSVAEHSVIVSKIVEALGGSLEEQQAALLHDAPEGLGLIDLPRPVKHAPELAPYREAEERVAAAVAKRFGLATIEPEIVKRVDSTIVANERDALGMVKHPAWTMQPLDGVAGETFAKYLKAGDPMRKPSMPPLAYMTFTMRARALFGEDCFSPERFG